MFSKGKGHYDIKTANFGWNVNGLVQFLDFGMTGGNEPTPTGISPSERRGTRGYMQHDGNGYYTSKNQDLWSFMIMISEMNVKTKEAAKDAATAKIESLRLTRGKDPETLRGDSG